MYLYFKIVSRLKWQTTTHVAQRYKQDLTFTSKFKKKNKITFIQKPRMEQAAAATNRNHIPSTDMNRLKVK